MSEEDESGTKETDLYALLAVARTASDDDIKKAYRLLAQICHPDKHQSAAMREVASQNFTRIHEAYEILSDPQKRIVYDLYGIAGLRSGLELGPRLKSREEIRREFEAAEALKEARRSAQRINYRGSYMFALSAADLLDPNSRSRDPRGARADADLGFALPEVTSVAMNNMVHLPMGRKDVAYMGGQVMSRRGLGGGTLVLGVKRQCSPVSTLEAAATAGLRGALTLTGTRVLSAHSDGSLSFSWSPKDGSSLTVGLERQLGENTRGHWSYTPGAGGGIATGFQRTAGRWACNAEVRVGVANGVSGAVVRQLPGQAHLRAAAKVGSTGVEVDLGGGQRLSADSAVGMSVTLGLQGIMLKFRLTRGGIKFVFPVLLAPTLRPRLAIASIVLPPVVVFLTKRYVLRPAAQRRRRREELRLRRESAQAVREALAAAARTAEMMAPAAARKRALQEASGGLVIECAVFGDVAAASAASCFTAAAAAAAAASADGAAPAAAGASAGAAGGAGAGGPGAGSGAEGGSDEESGLPPTWIDVTVAVQFLVEDRELYLAQDLRKSGLMGFCDTSPGAPTRPQLAVRYLFEGQPHETVAGEAQELRLPDAAHRVDPGAQPGVAWAKAAAAAAAAADDDAVEEPGDE